MTTTKHFSIQINHDPATIFALLTRLAHYGDWLPYSNSYTGLHDISDDPILLGSTYRDGHGALEMHGTITELVPNHRITFQQTTRPNLVPFIRSTITITISYTLEQNAFGTTLYRDYQLSLSGFFRLIKSVVIKRVTVENERVLALIKSHLEADS